MGKEMIKVKTGKKRYFLIKESNNWADEIDIEAMRLRVGYLSLAQFEKKLIDDIEAERDGYPFSSSIGTNEDIEFESRADVEDTIEVEELTASEYNYT